MPRHHLPFLSTLLSLAALFTACEKEIDIDYREAEPLYVVQAALTNQLLSVRISQTVPIRGSSPGDRIIENATVTVTAGDSISHRAVYTQNGRYIFPFRAYTGTRYQLNVTVGDHQFTSSSVLQPQPVVNSFRFVWKKMFSTRILFAELKIQDFSGQANYYFMHLYRNGTGYRWAVMRDTSNPGGELQQLFGCQSEDSDDEDNILHEGDNIMVEVRTIDKASYDYLSSMQQSDNSGSNPIPNFTGGCLGYFSAYIPYTFNRVFHAREADED